MRHPIKFGKYLLLERIAVGGMAEVFIAKAFGAEGFERLLAIKKILPTLGEDAEFISMFVDEARIAAQLAHANIVQVLELGKHEETLFIVMEYVSGRDLRQLMERYRRRQQPMPIPQAAYVVKEVCEALDHAHRKRDAKGRPLGIVHRDVSPQNVLVGFEGEVKLIDFGIAKAESRLQKTQAGILKGKFSYMSPEQVKGEPVDARSDVFACGILLWEMVTGEKLFTGDSDYAVLDKVRMGLVPPPRSRNPRCPEALEKVILKVLAVDPALRHQSASDLHDELVRFTVAADAVFGPRQLAAWLREEFASEYEQEQKRLRTWLSVARPPPTVPPVSPAARGAGAPAPQAPLPAVVVADLTRTPVDPNPPAVATRPQESPTLQIDTDALRGAPRFDVSQDATVAPRRMRGAALSRPAPRAGGARRMALYAVVPLAVVLAGISWVARTSRREALPGTVIVTLSPPVASADLAIDGRPSGSLPPFVHTLSPGRHRLEGRAEGFRPFAVTVEVAPGGQPREVVASLEPEQPMQLEGAARAQPPQDAPAETPLHKKAPAARPTASTKPAAATKPPAQRVIAAATPVAPAPEREPTQTSVPAPIGYLVVKTMPAARLTVDGRDLGRWTPVPPANPVTLPAGAHTLVLESADGRRLEEQVQIEAGKTARLVRSLP